jgi:subtilisin family serine protease
MSRPEDAAERGWRFETYEERLALSARPVAEMAYELSQAVVEPSSALVQPLGTAEGHGWTDLAAARALYGLEGSGQTVAVIDSGIAYDHVALGGGLGSSYKVIGGWDFAENDANPYDDGPAGFHGTHVSGIIGASDNRYPGVAPDVDLVGLRVFDDQGNSNITWVDQALQWVHQHRNDYAFPITTVNLSLGMQWNSSSVPGWATLESDLKQLADDGIFIAVAAGNAFQSYSAAGLAYPAASPYVTPVASVDAAGNLSRFSQRDSRVLAAPGERVMSTLPDAFYGGDGIKNDWGAASGTSMAAPYVAGASVLVREAMQDLGYSQITETTIGDLLHQTADRVYDPITQASYDRINVSRALAMLVGPDDFGSTAAVATSLAQVGTTLHLSGTIGSTTDQDYVQFTATASGKLTLTLSGGEQVGAVWRATAGEQVNGSVLTLDVTAGQTYVVGVAGGGLTIGKYAIDGQLTPAQPAAATATDLGVVDQTRLGGVAIQGDAWFKMTAAHSGQFTTEAFATASGGKLNIEVYDANQRLLAAGSAAGNQRIDVHVSAGDTLLLHVVGAKPSVDLRLTNLVEISSQAANISGTAGNDTIRWQADRQQVTVNGVSYALGGAAQVTITGGGGIDSLTLIGGAASEVVSLRPGRADLIGGGYRVLAVGCESIRFNGGSADQATLAGAAAGDLVEAAAQWTRISGSSYVNYVAGTAAVSVVPSGNVASAQAIGPQRLAVLDEAFASLAEPLSTLLARVRAAQKQPTHLAAVEFVFQAAGR